MHTFQRRQFLGRQGCFASVIPLDFGLLDKVPVTLRLFSSSGVQNIVNSRRQNIVSEVARSNGPQGSLLTLWSQTRRRLAKCSDPEALLKIRKKRTAKSRHCCEKLSEISQSCTATRVLKWKTKLPLCHLHCLRRAELRCSGSVVRHVSRLVEPSFAYVFPEMPGHHIRALIARGRAQGDDSGGIGRFTA